MTSLINLNKVSTKFYKPENDYERALLTRYERVQTQIVENQKEGAKQIADDIVERLKKKQKRNKKFVLTMPCGSAMREICDELVCRHKDGNVSFSNLVFFCQYELFPFRDDLKYGLSIIREMLLDRIDVLPENIHSIENDVSVNDVASACKRYEELIAEEGGLDYTITNIGKNGNIAHSHIGHDPDEESGRGGSDDRTSKDKDGPVKHRSNDDFSKLRPSKRRPL